MPRSPGRNSTGVEENLKAWEVLKSREIFTADPWLKLSVQQVRLPDGRVVDDYYQIQLSNFSLTFAETADGKVIVERMYKHGAGKVCLVLPAGSIEKGEEPLDSAKRELLEETGYVSDDWRPLGSFVVNGNYGCGNAHLFSARNARWVEEPKPGDLETIEIILMDPGELLNAISQGKMEGLGNVAAIALAMNPRFKA